jgi:hypothetical protein
MLFSKERHRLGFFESAVFRCIFGFQIETPAGNGDKFLMRA